MLQVLDPCTVVDEYVIKNKHKLSQVVAQDVVH
jgi:hypothetical protein